MLAEHMTPQFVMTGTELKHDHQLLSAKLVVALIFMVVGGGGGALLPIFFFLYAIFISAVTSTSD